MRLRALGIKTKLLIIVASLLALAAAATAITAVTIYNRALMGDMEQAAERLANITLASTEASAQATDVAESMLETQMLDQSSLLAHMLAAESLSQSDVIALANQTSIDEIYITDSDGVVVMSNNTGAMGWRFPDDPTAQAYEFRQLLTSHSGKVAQKAAMRDLDGKVFKFVGVSRRDSYGIVQIGVSAQGLKEMQDKLGAQATIEQMVNRKGIVYGLLVGPDGIIKTHSDRSLIGDTYKGQFAGNSDGRIVKQNGTNIYEYYVQAGNGDYLVFGLSMHEFEAAKGAALLNTLLMVAIVLAVALLVVWFWSGTFIKPIGTLIGHIREMAEGNFVTAIKSKSEDEIGQAFSALERLRQDMGTIIGQVASTAQNLASAGEQLAASTEETGASIQEVASTTNEFASTVTQMNGNAQRMAESADEVSDMADQGNAAITKAVAQTAELRDNITALAESVQGLGQRSSEIGKIVQVISAISEQTNLLALNAAIEAARAGEQGRGFAVVAEEVRQLAERSSKATAEIAGLIKEIQNETDKAVTGMNLGAKRAEESTGVVTQTGEVITKVLSFVDSIVSQIEDVASGAEQIGSGSQQIAAATEEQSASIEEVAASAQNLSNLAQQLQGLTERFRV